MVNGINLKEYTEKKLNVKNIFNFKNKQDMEIAEGCLMLSSVVVILIVFFIIPRILEFLIDIIFKKK